MKHLLRITTILLTAASLIHAADFRIWTSRQGTSIEAQLLQYKEDSVKVVTKEPKELVLKVMDLSLADRQYLIDYAGAKPDVVLAGTLSIPEHNYRKPKSFVTKLDKQFGFGDSSSLALDLYETEHFLFAVGKGVRVTGVAETAEACWHGMAFQHFEFRENWGTTKLLVIIPGDKETYNELGKMEIAALKSVGQLEIADRIQLTWDKVGANSMGVSTENREEFKLKRRASIFNVDDTKRFRRKFDSFQTHVLAGDLFGIQVGGVSSISGSGYFALSTGHSYYKEIQLSKKTETNMIASDYEDGLVTKSGFEDGSGWAKILKKLVKKGELTPNLDSILGIKGANDLTPQNMVMMYSLAYYMQSTQSHISSYAKLIRLINTSDQIPETSEFVKIFGFDSVADFEKAWTEFVVSKDFK